MPHAFVYALKASRYLTHLKKLKEPGPPLTRFFSRAKLLGPRLGPVLYQLPPHWTRDLVRLEGFLKALPKRRRHAIEFRDPSWYGEETFALLRRYRTALCLHDMGDSATGPQMTGPFVYLRLHGPQRYAGSYPDEILKRWAEWCTARLHEGIPVYVYFNNDIGACAPRDAVRLRELCLPPSSRAGS